MIGIHFYFGFAVVLLTSNLFVQCKRSIEVLKIEQSGNDPEKVEIIVQYKKIGKNQYGLSGKLVVAKDLDDTTIISTLVYDSFSANGYYKLTPYGTPPSKLSEWMNSFWKNILQEMLSKCSTLPTIEENQQWKAPYPKGEYTLTDCALNGDTIPDVVDPGYYKVEVKVIVGDATIETKISIRISES